tara:strand:+ start:321 stop:686 length:366 start_codon:yes stop_codon:yes gene_type:complete
MQKLAPTTELFANHHGYSDVSPYEIVRIVSDKCIEIRAMDTSENINKADLEFHVGGFSAHCSNQNSQDYIYTSNTENPVQKIRLNKVGMLSATEPNMAWKCKYGARYNIAEAPYKFHDYNF